MESLLFILPAAFALLALFIPKSGIKAFSIVASVAVFGVLAVLFANYNAGAGEIHFISKMHFLAKINLDFGYDAISLMMIGLTTALVPLILISNFKNEIAENRTFVSMVFFMQFGLIGVFLALDAVFFYVFWEITLIPIFIIAYLFGAPERKAALIKFFIYTFVGSLAMLASIFALGYGAKSFGYSDLIDLVLDKKYATWIMGGFLLAFAIKVPIFPFHTWQPATYSKSPMAGTMLLSGLMLKMALYGIIRWIVPMYPEVFSCKCTVEWIIAIATISVIYAAIIAIMQKDMKRLFAFASMSHVGLIAAGIFTLNNETISGSILQMVNHGFVAIGLFLAVDVIERRVNTRQLDELGGFAKQAPKFAFWFAALAFASVSVPFTSGFIGEFLLIKGVYNFQWCLGVLIGTSVIIGAVYTFRAYQLSMYGPTTRESFADLHWSELVVFAVILIVVVVLGVFPQAIIGYVQPSVEALIAHIK